MIVVCTGASTFPLSGEDSRQSTTESVDEKPSVDEPPSEFNRALPPMNADRNDAVTMPARQITMIQIPRRHLNSIFRTKSDGEIGNRSSLSNSPMQSVRLVPVTSELKLVNHSNRENVVATEKMKRKRKTDQEIGENLNPVLVKRKSFEFDVDNSSSDALSSSGSCSSSVMNRASANRTVYFHRGSVSDLCKMSASGLLPVPGPLSVVPLVSSNIANTSSSRPAEGGTQTFQRPVIVIKRFYQKNK